MRFFHFVLKNVGRRRTRSALTIAGMAIAVGAVVSLVGISRGFEKSFLAVYERQNVDILVQQKGVRQRLTSALDESLGERIAAIEGVDIVNRGLVDFITMEGAGPIGVLVQGWPEGAQQFKDLENAITAGRLLREDDSRGVLLGKNMAATLDAKVGSEIDVFPDWPKFRVIGIFESTNVYEDNMIVMLLPTLQKFMGREGKVNGFAVVCKSGTSEQEIKRIAQQIEKLGSDPEVAATPRSEFVRQTSELQVVRAMSWVTSAIALIIGAVGMLNTMIMSVFERTKEIGILRAIGWRKGRIVRMILVESLILSVSGGIVGTLGAISLTRFLSGLRWAAGVISGQIPPMVMVEGFVIAILIGVIGAAYPAWRGAQLAPTEALRHE